MDVGNARGHCCGEKGRRRTIRNPIAPDTNVEAKAKISMSLYSSTILSSAVESATTGNPNLSHISPRRVKCSCLVPLPSTDVESSVCTIDSMEDEGFLGDKSACSVIGSS